MNASKEYPHLLRAADIKRNEETDSHPWNPKSLLTGTHLSRAAGLKRTGISIVRLAPGKESFAYHTHYREEEWIYILSGRPVAEIDDAEYDLEPGDFVAFPTPSVAHNLCNRSEEEVVYLMGGESLDAEIADFPRLGKRIVRVDGEYTAYDIDSGETLGPFDE
jgi:uncharacterized cupin superfamily protein